MRLISGFETGSKLKSGNSVKDKKKFSCDDGLVPIVRQSLETIAGFETLERYLLPVSSKTKLNGTDYRHFYATASHSISTSLPIRLINSQVGLWSPKRPYNNQSSITQIWLLYVSANPRQTIELGFQMQADMKSSVPFVYSTSNNYDKESSCFNTCFSGHGIILTTSSNPFTPFPVDRYSTEDNEKFVQLSAELSPEGDWHIYIDDIDIGYYSPDEFKRPGESMNISNGANALAIGGETGVIGNQAQTLPQMGSGHLPSNSKAASIKNIVLAHIGEDNPINAPLGRGEVTPGPQCYDLISDSEQIGGTKITYGGPGCIH